MVYYLVYKVQLIYIRISSYPFRLRNIYNYLVSSGIMSDIDDDLTDDEIKILELLPDCRITGEDRRVYGR